MGELSNADVHLMASLSGLPLSEAVKWLKGHNGDVTTAINAFWDDPKPAPSKPSRDTWNEAQFHCDKTESIQSGQQQRSEDPWEDLEGARSYGRRVPNSRIEQANMSVHAAFTVHPQDTLKPSVFDAAPSRPPSRVSTRAGAPIDHTDGSKMQWSDAEQEDAQLKQAMAISMSQNIPGQESGVTNPSPYFGPATRQHYENSNWTMTVPRSNTKEILLNPEPIDRMRETHTPAFLKPSTDGNRLPALIKILQAIPMSREALLGRHNTVKDYGYDSDWWDGTAIKASTTVNFIFDGIDSREEDLIRETQRLIAFLEGTDRAYGSAENLSNLPGIGDLGVDQLLARYLDKWRGASGRTSPANPLHNIFKSTGLKTQSCEPRIEETHDFYVLELRIDETLSDRGQTLYEAIDDILWTDENEGAYQDGYFSQVGDLFIVEAIRVGVAGSGLGIKIPLVWYSDRYLESSISQVKEMQAGKTAIKKDIEKLDLAKAEIQRCQTSSKLDSVDSTRLLNTAITFFERSTFNKATRNGSEEVQDDMSISPEPERYSKIAEELRALAARIAQMLKKIEESKKLAQEKLDELSKLYTKPPDSLNDPPHHKYTLRGVCTTPDTVYTLEKTQPDIKDDMLSTEARDWQWWKLKYAGGESKPISHTKVREIEVLKAAKDESRSALLVYASERAVSYETEDLPPQLQNFVRLDNLSFTAELEKAASPKPKSPTKRKADEQEDEDLMSRLYHSPQDEEHVDLSSSAVGVDPTLPAYASTSPSPPFSPSRPSHSSARNLRNLGGGYDNQIPRSLRATGPTIDPSSMMLNQDDPSEMGQEMQDRGGSLGMLHRRNGTVDSGYTLGSYVPEITMDDKDEEEVPQTQHIEYANPR